MNDRPESLTLSNADAAWHLAVHGGRIRTERLDNRRSGRSFVLTSSGELSVLLSASPGSLAQPYRVVEDFEVIDAHATSASAAAFSLWSRATGLEARVHLALEGPVRRKVIDFHNASSQPLLLLDIVLDEAAVDAEVEAGGQGQPLLVGGELWAAVEHPSGLNEVGGPAAGEGQHGIRLSHCPGRLLHPGDALRSRASLVSVSPTGQALPSFVSWIQARCLRARKGLVSVYTPFGINNQWGPCPTLDDEETLHVLDVLEGWRKKGARFDYFTLDTGWVDTGSDLKRFRPVAYPEGPDALIDRIRQLGMRFGLWFATSWASQSCWDYAPAWGGRRQPDLTWRNGYAAMTDYAGSFCLAAPPYFAMLKAAVLHHIRENGVRFLKFDGGNYACDDPSHGHLPGKYAVERMHDLLIELADAARREAPDVFIMWYWGLRSPFWALHGDTIFESGLFMEGSGTSSTPTLHYRDSVTLAQDQNACHARTIPPIAKDSLGVWLAHTRWGNYMGRERWREALVMDLGRGNLLFPNLWGDLELLDESDVRFVAELQAFARGNEALLLTPRTILGDPMRDGVYGYAYVDGGRGLVFLNNPCFEARPVVLGRGSGFELPVRAGRPVAIVSWFPERASIPHADGRPVRAGDALEVWLRPFEVLLLEARPPVLRDARLPIRPATDDSYRRLGIALELCAITTPSDLDVVFADAARHEGQGHRQTAQAWEATLPDLQEGGPAVLAIAVRLRRNAGEWKYSPVVAEVVQAVARVGGERLVLVPVPDARQFGNTQKAGCSWIVYKSRLARRWSGAGIRLAVHGLLPADVRTLVEAWIVRRWWSGSARPAPDGYYADAPS